MNKIWIIICTLAMALTCASVEANAIRGIDLTYDLETQALDVSVKHISRDRRDEYIRKIIIYRNGEQIKEEYYNLQKDPSVFEEVYEFTAEVGDTIKVEAFAAQGGKKSESIEVTETSEEETDAKKGKTEKNTPAVEKGSGY